MPELKTIPTITELFLSGTSVSIKTSYFVDELPNTLSAVMADNSGSQDMVPYVQGDLIIQMKNNPSDIDYSLSSDGELILLTNTGDAGNYSIDTDGNLIYTT
jgi:hypothetical protein